MRRREPKGVSDRSGFVYPLGKMRREWTGLLVGPDEWEAKHPQLTPRRVGADPKPLRNPRPARREPVVVLIGQPDLPGQPFSAAAVNTQARASAELLSLGVALWGGALCLWENQELEWEAA